MDHNRSLAPAAASDRRRLFDHLAALVEANAEFRARLNQACNQPFFKAMPTADLVALLILYGGVRIKVPTKDSGPCRLRKVLSPEGMRILQEERRGETVNVPTCRTMLLRLLVPAVRNAGASVSETALQLWISERTVYSIMAEQRIANRAPRTISHRKITDTTRTTR